MVSEGRIGSDRNKGNMRVHIESDSESDSSISGIQSVSNSSDDSEDSGVSSTGDDFEDFAKRIRRGQALKAKGPELASYRVSDLTPLSTSPAWVEINARLNIRLTGPDSLQSLCDEAHFARWCLTKTSLALLNDLTQAKAALFCLEQIANENTTEDLRVAFAKILPYSLSHTCQSPELTTNIRILLTQHPTLCKRLPLVTTKAMADYLSRFPSPSPTRPQKKFWTIRVLVSPFIHFFAFAFHFFAFFFFLFLFLFLFFVFFFLTSDFTNQKEIKMHV